MEEFNYVMPEQLLEVREEGAWPIHTVQMY